MTPTTASRSDLTFLKDSITLPSLPGVAIEVMRLTQEDNVELETVAEAIGRDPALAARLLKLSNSSFFGRATQVATLGESVMVLGMKTVRLAAVSFSVVPLIGRGDQEGYDYREFWARAVTAAVCARELSRSVSRELADEAFICGLLMDIGIPILLRAAPERYHPAMRSMDAGHPDLNEERRGLGFSHADVGAELMRRWNLPESLVTAIAHHHDPESLGSDADRRTDLLTKITRVAHDVATLMVSDSNRGLALSRARESLERYFSLDEDDLDELLEDITEPISQLAELIEVDIGDPSNPKEVMDQARTELTTQTVVNSDQLESTRSGTSGEVLPSTDALTGMKDGSTFHAALNEALARTSERGDSHPLSLIVVDIDHLDDLNDVYGRAGGDRALQVMADVIQRCTRVQDQLFRLKDDAFAVITPDLTPVQTKALTQRMLRAIGSTAIVFGEHRLTATASLGGVTAVTNLAEVTAEEMLRVAKELLDDAKDAGRNQVRTRQLP